MTTVNAKQVAELVGGNIRRVRESSRMGVAQLAKEAKLAAVNLDRVERGERLLLLPELFAVAGALAVPVRVLVDADAEGVSTVWGKV